MRKGKDSEGRPAGADGIDVPKKEDHVDPPGQTGESAMKLAPVGIDIAKSVFQVHHVDEETGSISATRRMQRMLWRSGGRCNSRARQFR